MGSVFGRAIVVAGAVVVALGSAAGSGVHPLPVRLRAGRRRQAASRTFTLANNGGQATGRLRVTLAGSAAFTTTGDTTRPPTL